MTTRAIPTEEQMLEGLDLTSIILMIKRCPNHKIASRVYMTLLKNLLNYQLHYLDGVMKELPKLNTIVGIVSHPSSVNVRLINTKKKYICDTYDKLFELNDRLNDLKFKITGEMYICPLYADTIYRAFVSICNLIDTAIVPERFIEACPDWGCAARRILSIAVGKDVLYMIFCDPENY